MNSYSPPVTKVRLSILCTLFWVTIPGANSATPDEQGHAVAQVLPTEALPGDPLIARIGQLPDGRMIFSTREGLLLHDGHFTETIPFPRKQLVFDISGQPDGVRFSWPRPA